MKEFARICMETGDQSLIRNLEALLNTEISLKSSKTQLLGDYQNLPREIDPVILSQPGFNVSSVGEKMNSIQKYLDLVKE